ncbi:MAG: anti-sigma factor family protein [Candidatus Zipacnadales bacterium]
MRCSIVQNHLAEYVDGLLEPHLAEAVGGHLETCTTCRTAAEDIRYASRVLRSLPPLRTPATFAPRIRSAIRKEAEKLFPITVWLPEARAIFGGVLLLVGILLATHHFTQPRPYVRSLSVPTGQSKVTSSRVVSDNEPAFVNAIDRSRRSISAESRTTLPAPHDRNIPPRLESRRTARGGLVARTERVVATSTDVPSGDQSGESFTAPLISTTPVSIVVTADIATRMRPELAEDNASLTPSVPPLRALHAPELAGLSMTLVAATTPQPPLTSEVHSLVSDSPPPSEADAPFGFEDIFNEKNLPRFADLS